MEVPMNNRKPYRRRFNILLPWTLKAIALVIAGATIVMVGLTIANRVSFTSDSDQGGKIIGKRHDATAIPSNVHIAPDVATADLATASPSYGGQGQEGSATTVVQNGITVVTPQLRVPVIDLAAIEAANAPVDDTSSTKASSAQKRASYPKRSTARRQTDKRWPAYGVAIR